MDTTRPLRGALLANALFSFATGTTLMLAPAAVGTLLGDETPRLLQGLGAALAIFAAVLVLLATRPRVATWWALAVTSLDLLWVVLSAAAVLAFSGALSSSGVALVAAVAAVVAGLAGWQLRAIDRTHRVPGTAHRRHCVRVHVALPPEALWRVIRKLGEIERYMPSLASSELLGGARPGVGAVRHCTTADGRAWSEECTAYEPGRRIVLRFRSEADDFPFPASEMTGGWTLTPADGGTVVTVWWELIPRPIYAAPILLPAFAYRADRELPEVVARMADAAAGTSSHPDVPAWATPRPRVMARPC